MGETPAGGPGGVRAPNRGEVALALAGLVRLAAASVGEAPTDVRGGTWIRGPAVGEGTLRDILFALPGLGELFTTAPAAGDLPIGDVPG